MGAMLFLMLIIKMIDRMKLLSYMLKVLNTKDCIKIDIKF